MMRKTILHGTRHVVTTLLLAAAFLSLAQPSDAAPITRKQAEQRAAKFFHKRMARKAAPVQLSLALEKPTDATSAGYYIYNKVGGGYAIVSADDTQAAIIGFSDSGHIDADEMPDNMRWWLEGFYRQAKTDEQTDYPDPIAPMLTSQWGQYAPYNQQTPLFDNVHAPAGCGAVALAQIIRYQQWPFSVDDIPSTNQCEKLPPTTFDFDKLLDTYDADSPDDCQEEVAKLMRYVGQAISTTYGRNSSSVKRDGVEYGILTYLKFQNSFIKKRNAYPNQGVWEDEMYESLHYGNPVFYGGEKATSGGHAFVLDGYRDGYFHINWGWKGSYDGYFLLSDLSYNKNQYAFTNLQNPYSGADLIPSEVIHTSDMFFNPELSDEGCLIRENEEDDFAGIVIQEDRFFDIGKVNATIQYGLALCEDVNVIEVLADTLLDLSDTDSRKQRLTFRFSIGHDIPCGGYSFQTVSRCSEDDAWQINNINAIDLYENSYIVDILEDRIYLDYVTSNFTNPSSSIKTGFLSDEKYLTIDEEGIVSQNLKIICNYSGNLPNHYYDYWICLEGDDTGYPVKPILLQKPLSSAKNIPCVFDFDMSDLPDGDYYLRGVECECGRNPDWGILGYPNNDEKVKLFKQGNRIYVEPESLTMPTCNRLILDVKDEAVYDVVKYTPNASTATFDVPIKYSVSNSQEGGYADSGVGLFYDGTLQHILYSNNCEYLTDNTITRDATVHIPADLPEGDYTIRGIGRDANTTEWQDISAEEAVLFATLKNDTLRVASYELYNTKNLHVDDIAYLNDHEVRLSMSNPSDYPMKGYVTVTFSAIDPSMIGGIIEPRDTCSYRMKVSLGKHESTSLVVPVSLTTEANDFVFYDCQFKVLNDTYSLSGNFIAPLATHIDFDDVSIDSVNDSTLFDRFRLYFTFKASPAAERTMVVARNVDEAGNILAEYCHPYSGDKVTSACYLDFMYYPLYYPHYVNSKIHFELGYTKYFNDTVIVYRSHDYELAPFVTVESYQDNVSQYSEQHFSDGWTVPENVTYVSFEKASRVGEMVSVVPNHNPNTVYLFREDQPVPDCMQDRFVTTSEQIGSREFHIIDPYPVTTEIYGSNIQYQQHFNSGEWVLLGTPFVRVTDLDALSQFDDVMVFDHIQDNTIYFKEWEQTANVREWPTLYLVRGSDKEVNFINGDYGISSKIADYLGPTWGNFKAMRRLIPCHYDVMYQLSPDGTHFYLTEGDVQPFRFVLLPTGSEIPERIKVVIEGYDPPTAITDVREQPQVKARYATDGRAVGNGYHGIVVEVDGNGKARKVVRQ